MVGTVAIRRSSITRGFVRAKYALAFRQKPSLAGAFSSVWVLIICLKSKRPTSSAWLLGLYR